MGGNMAKSLIFQVKTVQTFLLKSNPPKLLIHAEGLTTTLGWTNPRLKLREEELTPDGVLDLNFVAKAPDAGSGDAFEKIEADYLWEEDADKVRAVIVYARSNTFTTEVGGPTLPKAPSWPTPPRPWPWPPFPSPLPPSPPLPMPPSPGPWPFPPGPLAVTATNFSSNRASGVSNTMPPTDPLDLGYLIEVCRWSTENAYAEERGIAIRDHHSPSLPTLHTTPENWIDFFRRHIEPRINSFDPRYANATHSREMLEELYPNIFRDIYVALARNIQQANGR